MGTEFWLGLLIGMIAGAVGIMVIAIIANKRSYPKDDRP